MAYPRDLYQNMPLYAQFADDIGIGLLRHVCEAFQPHLDLIYNRLDQRDYILDPEVAPGYWLDWLQQLVSLGPQGDRWLGLAVNPYWDIDAKRNLILGAWAFWQSKGTTPATRWAIARWLLWEPAFDPVRLDLYLPLGDRATDQPPRWWDYYTDFDHNSHSLILEQKFMGGYDGDLEARARWSEWRSVDWRWEYDYPFPAIAPAVATPIDPPIAQIDPQRQWHPGQMMGVNHPYEIFQLRDRAEWNAIAPDIYDLNPEILNAASHPTVWLWLDRTLDAIAVPKRVTDPDTGNPTEVFRFEPDGFKYTDLFPFAPRPGNTITEWIETTELWGNWDYAFTYADSFGRPAQILSDGQWIETAIAEPGNLDIAFDYATVWSGVAPGSPVNDGYALGSARDYYDDYTVSFYGPPPPETTIALGIPVGGNARDWYDTYSAPFYGPPTIAPLTIISPPSVVGSGAWLYYPACDRIERTWIDEDITLDAIAVRQWYAPWAARIVRMPVTTELPPISCTPGQPSEMVGETSIVVTPGRDAIAPSQTVTHTPATTTTETIAAINGQLGIDYYDPFPIYGFPKLPTLTALPELATLAAIAAPPTITLATYDNQRSWWDIDTVAIQPVDSFTMPGRAAQTITVDHPSTWAWDGPTFFFNYSDRWDAYLPFYYPGEDAIAPTETEVPGFDPVRLCNIRDNWTLFEIESYWYDTLPPEAQPPIRETYPTLNRLLDVQQWRVIVDTDRGQLDIPITASVWENADGDRSNDYRPDDGFDRMIIEFTAIPDQIRSAHAIALHNGTAVIDYHNLPAADLRPNGIFGWRYRSALALSN